MLDDRSGDYLPRRPNLTLRAWLAICESHRTILDYQARVRELRAEMIAADARFRQVVRTMMNGQAVTPWRLVPYTVALDDAHAEAVDRRSQLIGTEIAYEALHTYWADRVDKILHGRVVAAVATERCSEGFTVITQHGGLPGMRVYSVVGPYASYDPEHAVLSLGSPLGGVQIPLVVPGDIYQRYANIEVREEV